VDFLSIDSLISRDLFLLRAGVRNATGHFTSAAAEKHPKPINVEDDAVSPIWATRATCMAHVL
jgi:hypothetical protein